MKLPQPTAAGTLIRRYKRFLADIELENGGIITAHCANPGAMTGLNIPGLPVLISKSSNPNRKLQWNFEIVELETGPVCINTSYPNKIIAESLAAKQIAELAHYDNVRPEVKYGTKSRVDFLLRGTNLPDCYLEVKNVHLCRTPGLAAFPDSVTTRGAKHLDELARVVEAGHRAINLYLVQRTDCTAFTLAKDLDPKYAAAFAKAKHAGVEMLCYSCEITKQEIVLGNALPIIEH